MKSRQLATPPRRAGWLSVSVLMLLAGCGSEPSQSERAPSDADIVISDSSNVVIATVSTHRVDAKPGSVDLGAAVRLGRAGETVADSAYVIGSPVGYALLSDGRVAIADSHRQDVRVFGADGTVTQVIGRRGEGPGEFSILGRVYAFRGDSLLVGEWDGTVSVFSDSGNFARSFRVPRDAAGHFPQVRGVFEDGSALLHSAGENALVSEETGMLARDAAWAIVGPDGSADTFIGRFPEYRTIAVRGPDGRLRINSSTVGPLAIAQGRKFYLTDHALRSVSIYDKIGSLTRILRFADTISVHAEPPVNMRPNRPDSELDRVVVESLKADRSQFGASPFASLVVDDSGNLWLREQRDVDDDENDRARWLVVSPDGEPVGSLDLPYWWGVGGWGMQVAHGYILALERDALERSTFVRVKYSLGSP